MASQKQLNLLKEGATVWNKWRNKNKGTLVDLYGCDLAGVDLSDYNLILADLKGSNLSKAILIGTNLGEAELTGANLTAAILDRARLFEASLDHGTLSKASCKGTDFSYSNLSYSILSRADFSAANLSGTSCFKTNFTGAKLREANLTAADLQYSDLTDADLTGAYLGMARIIETTVTGCTLTNSFAYGLAAWDLKGVPKDQTNIKITPPWNTEVTVDNIQIAQFIYLLLNNENIRGIINTLTSKAVLILGRFTKERKEILNAMAIELRKHNFLPIIFDFERSASRDFTETIKILAGISLFIIADITNPKSSPLELQATVPDYQIPFVPIIEKGEEPFSMMSDLIGKFDWVLDPVVTYTSKENLIKGFKEGIIDRAWDKHQQLQKKKTVTIQTQSIDDFLRKRG